MCTVALGGVVRCSVCLYFSRLFLEFHATSFVVKSAKCPY
jgi:hypothetical protein